jgi:hypothetical protein
MKSAEQIASTPQRTGHQVGALFGVHSTIKTRAR